MIPILAALVFSFAPGVGGVPSDDPADPREHYDVRAYRLDLAPDPEARKLEGLVGIQVDVTASALGELVLDLDDACRVQSVSRVPGLLTARADLSGSSLRFEQQDDRLVCQLDSPARRGETLVVAVRYSVHPRAKDRFTGFHWRETPDGQPWIATSYQALGAHHWWPCKASYFHPADKPDRVFVNVTVPGGLTAVANGRQTGTTSQADGRETWHWSYDYPIETYLVAINVGPYRAHEEPLTLAGVDDPVPFAYYVLAQDEAKAAVQFAEVPELLGLFSSAFGPWPFPGAKVGIVQTPFLGMEHSTALAYGSSFPSWLQQHGEQDRMEHFNRHFDYVLVHQLAHEWWGNSVSASDWSDFWIHEGFATFAGAMVIEARRGRRAADAFFDEIEDRVGKTSRLMGRRGATARDAYSPVLYYKGAWVLNTLRHYVNDDDAFWGALRAFQARHLHGNASSEDLRRAFEESSGRDWSAFFEQWVEGEGFPRIAGEVALSGTRIEVRVRCEGSPSTQFDVPLDLSWHEGDDWKRKRVWLAPGANELELSCASTPRDLRVLHLDRVLGPHSVSVKVP